MKRIFLFIIVLSLTMGISACRKEQEDVSASNSTGKDNSYSVSSNNNIIKVQALNDDAFANSKGIYMTQKYLYWISNFGVFRYDKITHTKDIISDESADVVCITKDSIYYIEKASPVKLYEMDDTMQSAEYLFDLSNEGKYFMNEKYIYSVSQNGSVLEHINSSSKYFETSNLLYQGNESDVIDIRLCGSKIYYTNRRTHMVTIVYIESKEVKQISLSGNFRDNDFGNTMHNNGVYYSDNKIIYSDANGIIYIVNSDTEEYDAISNIKASSFFVANKTIYVSDTENYCINLVSGEIEEFICPREVINMFGYTHQLSDIGTGIIYLNHSNDLVYVDYNGNIISKIQQ